MDDNQVELYDLDKDIHENQNLAKEQPALVQSSLPRWKRPNNPIRAGRPPDRRKITLGVQGIKAPSFIPYIFLSAGQKVANAPTLVLSRQPQNSKDKRNLPFIGSI